MKPRNRFHGIYSASLCSLARRYDNPIPTRFLTPIDCLKIPAQLHATDYAPTARIVTVCPTVPKFLVLHITGVKTCWSRSCRNTEIKHKIVFYHPSVQYKMYGFDSDCRRPKYLNSVVYDFYPCLLKVHLLKSIVNSQYWLLFNQYIYMQCSIAVER
jgi:hypothetical protein